ncbi:hypothetical protein DSO57_1025293 [Entomophthora muscae]|uniref:Uncharacterized protein n=1 Tax=Entomophthora muscae TaxID=34485 RepID=A0ACC2RGZ2_9FUNG|nr:hypothetical protein DSO57_1025293 [Entomophthora muscae]
MAFQAWPASLVGVYLDSGMGRDRGSQNATVRYEALYIGHHYQEGAEFQLILGWWHLADGLYLLTVGFDAVP